MLHLMLNEENGPVILDLNNQKCVPRVSIGLGDVRENYRDICSEYGLEYSEQEKTAVLAIVGQQQHFWITPEEFEKAQVESFRDFLTH